MIDREWNIARYWEEYEEYSPDWPMTPNALRQDAALVRHDRPCDQDVRQHPAERPDRPAGGRCDHGDGEHLLPRGRFDDADYHYTLLRREYPRSELQFEAHLLGLQAKLRKYQGADYDGTPLEEAKTLVKQLRVAVCRPAQPDEEKERLRTVEGQLNLEIATRDYRMAEYYDGTKHYGAAQYYYAQVIKKYPDTELAKQARERLAQIGGEPEKPPKRLAWFVDLFPESSERSRVARIPELQNGGTRLAEPPAAIDDAP